MAWNEELETHLRWLLSGGDAGLEGGAELEVRHPDGTLAFLAPLARHHLLDSETAPERTCIWIRPVVGGYTPEPGTGAPPYAFDLVEARRRNLTFSGCRRDGDALVFDLEVGQHAWVRPARAELLVELARWDTYYYVHLSAEEQAALDALEADTG